MVDPRFYIQVGEPSAASLAAALGGAVLSGNADQHVRTLARSGEAAEGSLVFLDDGESEALALLDGGVALVPSHTPASPSCKATLIAVASPRSAFAKAAPMIAAPRALHMEAIATGIHPDAQIHPNSEIEPHCIVGPNAAIGAGTRIGAGSVIGPGVQIGQGCRIGARTTIGFALIGDDVTLLSGVVVGENGFGLGVSASGARLLPHFGRVIIQNGVSVGANSTIDRGFLADTVIGEGTQIDNLCHIAHNVRVGRNVVMAAFAGISGSVVIGDGAMLGGRVGVADHVSVGAGARLAAGSAIMRDVPAGETYGGYPGKALRTWMRELAWLAQAAQKRPGGKG